MLRASPEGGRKSKDRSLLCACSLLFVSFHIRSITATAFVVWLPPAEVGLENLQCAGRESARTRGRERARETQPSWALLLRLLTGSVDVRSF